MTGGGTGLARTCLGLRRSYNVGYDEGCCLGISEDSNGYNILHGELAEGVGFEPTVPAKVQRFSRPPRSATPAPLRCDSFLPAVARPHVSRIAS